jgi:cyclopropane fatty-acyl-phospholipid synthase-like methyltransferase
MSKKSLQQSYNNFAALRDKSTIEPWKAKERDQFLNLLKNEGSSSLLEIGAGTGRDSLYFQQQGLDVTCVDLSEEMVKLCRDKGLNGTQGHSLITLSQILLPITADLYPAGVPLGESGSVIDTHVKI